VYGDSERIIYGFRLEQQLVTYCLPPRVAVFRSRYSPAPNRLEIAEQRNTPVRSIYSLLTERRRRRYWLVCARRVPAERRQTRPDRGSPRRDELDTRTGSIHYSNSSDSTIRIGRESSRIALGRASCFLPDIRSTLTCMWDTFSNGKTTTERLCVILPIFPHPFPHFPFLSSPSPSCRGCADPVGDRQFIPPQPPRGVIKLMINSLLFSLTV
jgi:hypothetical protein